VGPRHQVFRVKRSRLLQVFSAYLGIDITGSCPAGTRPVRRSQKGRAAPLRRGNAGPYQRPPPARLTTDSAKVQDHRVALIARIRRSPYGTWPVLGECFDAVSMVERSRRGTIGWSRSVRASLRSR
jgi:hypothetical protein